MKATLIISSLMTLFSIWTLSPDTGIQGKVTEAGTGEPVLFGTVAAYKDGVVVTGTDTDFDGNYQLNDLDPGSYDIEVAYVGLQTQRIKGVIVKAGKMTQLNFEMEEEDVLVDVIEVVGYKVPLVEMDNTTSGAVITSSSISNRSSSKSSTRRRDRRKRRKEKKALEKSLPKKNISALAATSAGVSTSAAGTISVRGSRVDPSYYYIDGVRVNAEKSAAAMIPEAEVYQLGHADEEELSNEHYEKSAENAFVSPLVESHSTFSLDVDKASYSNVRRMITYGQVPPPAAVRVEEMVNYFDYTYKQPTSEHPIVVHQNLTTCPWNKDHQLLHLSMKAKEIATDQLPPSNLVYLVDVSGSMSERNKLPLVIKSLKLLVEQLRPQDRVAIVTYAGKAGVALPSTSATNKKEILAGLDRLKSGGGTAGAQGIITAYNIAKENFIEGGNNRVILTTDGDFNVGVSSAAGLEKLIEKKRETGIFLSILGFGTRNYQDHKMQTLATKGNGNHAYIDSYTEAKKVFVKEFSGTLFTVAKDVKIQIEFNPAHVQSYRLIGYENRMLAKEDFNDDKKDAGEVGAGHTVTAIYEIIPPGSDSEFTVSVSKDQLEKSRSGKQADSNQALAYIKCRYKQPDADTSTKFEDRIPAVVKPIESLDNDIQFSVAVAEFGMNLSQSKYLKTSDLNSCMNRANNNRGKDKEGYRNEFVELVKEYMAINALASKN